MLMRMWRDAAGPCMQVLHFCFAFGAFVAPTIAKFFISEDRDQSTDNSTAESITTSSSLHFPSTFPPPDDDDQSRFRLAYWIVSTLFLPSLIAFMYFAIKFEFLEHKQNMSVDETQGHSDDEEIELEMNTLSTTTAAVAATQQDGGPPAGMEDILQTAQEDVLTKEREQGVKYKYILLVSLAVFMFVYVGMEVAFGTLIFTVVVRGTLDFSKSQGTEVQSLFWGTFTFGRLLSILLVACKVRSSIMISLNLLGSLVAAAIMVAFVHSIPAIWIGSAILGSSYSSIYPTVMTWMSENVQASGIATAILVTGGMLGDITLPAAVGAVVARVSPDSLFYMTFMGVVVSVAIVALLFWTARVKKRSEKEESLHHLHVSDVSVTEETTKLMNDNENSDEESLI